MPAVVAAAAAAALAAPPGAQTAFGTVKGAAVKVKGYGSVDQYLGIPYASAPVGDLRFAPPRDWAGQYAGGALDATKAGSACPQQDLTAVSKTKVKGAEDCLYLNVWAPAGANATAPLAVMVFIHGGSFVYGSGTDALYTGEGLAAQQGVVVVTLNYRLGALGFMAFDNGDGTLAANFGLQDQLSALRWVRAQVAAFGGDAGRVMVFGESAGALSINHLMTSDMAKGAFDVALSESGYPGDSFPRDFAVSVGAAFAARLNCTGAAALACMRGADVAAVTKAQLERQNENPNAFLATGWGTAVDGVVLKQNPFTAWVNGDIISVRAFVAGSNTDEGAFFTYPFYPKGLDAAAYHDFTEQFVRGHGASPSNASVAAIEALYPCSDADCLPAAVRLTTDGTFLCGARAAVRAAAQKGIPAYEYHYDYRGVAQVGPMYQPPGVFHTLELAFVFYKYSMAMTAKEKTFATRVGKFWADFAKTGSPDGAAAPAEQSPWPQYSAAADANIILKPAGTPDGFSTETGYRKTQCDVWDKVWKDEWIH